MLTAILLLLAATIVLAAGEAVRGQCRRMLTSPVAVPVPNTVTGDAPA